MREKLSEAARFALEYVADERNAPLRNPHHPSMMQLPRGLATFTKYRKEIFGRWCLTKAGRAALQDTKP